MADRVGAELRAAREARGLSVADVAQRTRIPIRHLSAIESGNYEGLPAATYSAGFVKNYARLLGLDGHLLSQQFRTELAETEPASPRREIYEPADPARTPSRTMAWSALIVAILLGVGYLYWRGATLRDDPRALAARGPAEQAAPATPTPQPVAAAPVAPIAAAANAPNPAEPATLTADSAVWIKVYEKDGPTLFMGVLDPGKTFAVPATATDPRLQTGRPNALRVTVGNSQIPALGAPERLVKDVSLKPDALLARLAPAAAPPKRAADAPVAAAPGSATPVANSAAPD